MFGWFGPQHLVVPAQTIVSLVAALTGLFDALSFHTAENPPSLCYAVTVPTS